MYSVYTLLNSLSLSLSLYIYIYMYIATCIPTAAVDINVVKLQYKCPHCSKRLIQFFGDLGLGRTHVASPRRTYIYFVEIVCEDKREG